MKRLTIVMDFVEQEKRELRKSVAELTASFCFVSEGRKSKAVEFPSMPIAATKGSSRN